MEEAVGSREKQIEYVAFQDGVCVTAYLIICIVLSRVDGDYRKIEKKNNFKNRLIYETYYDIILLL